MLVAILGIAAAVIAVLAIRDRRAGVPVDSEITIVTYSYGGGELGDSYTLTLSEGKIIEESCEGNGAKTHKRTARADQGVYDEIEVIAGEYEMKNWHDLPQSEEFALDAPTAFFSIDFADGTWISLDSGDIPPQDGWNGVNRIRELLTEKLK